MTEKNISSNYREDFPGYSGYIPYKLSVIGKTVGATNDTIKQLLTSEPPKQTLLKPMNCEDYSQYNRDYYCDGFGRDYPLEENLIFSNRSGKADSWLSGDKFKIYPQHIPGVKCHIPGIYSSNIYGKNQAKTSAVSIKGNYNKEQDCTNEERFLTNSMIDYRKPKTRADDDNEVVQSKNAILTRSAYDVVSNNIKAEKGNLMKIYKSKIALVPTVGYAGHTSVFHQPVSYLNFNKILDKEKKEQEQSHVVGDDLSDGFKKSIHSTQMDQDVPYVVGYKGFRVGVRARNYHAENFHNASLMARNEAKILNEK